MKRLSFFLTTLLLATLITGCYKDDIRDLNKKYNQLKQEQERQAQLLATYQSLLNALENKLTIDSIEPDGNGYKIKFSNGTEISITDNQDGHTPILTIGENGNWFIDGVDSGKKSTGENGTSSTLTIVNGYWHLNGVNTGVKAIGEDGTSAPYIVSIVDVNGTIVFHMSDGTTITVGKTVSAGLYVLSEGSFGNGDGQLVYFDYNSATDKYIRNNAKRFQNYGETPNDLIIYGSKMYCAITGSGNNGMVRVIDPKTGATIRDIPITKESIDLQPRRLTVHGGKVYVSTYKSTVAKIDTLDYTVNITTIGGTLSEGICVAGENLYICNSGQGAGNTISIVNIAQFEETGTITVPYNPIHILYVGNNELYFNTASVWTGPAAGTPANLHILNTSSKTVTKTFNLEIEFIAKGKEYVYGSATDWDTYGTIFKKISIADKSVSDFTVDPEDYMFGYKLAVNPLNDEVFLTQQMGDWIDRFSKDGTWIEQLQTGKQNGAAIAFVNVVK